MVSIYAKKYCPYKSVVKINPIRLYANLVFPEQDNATFTLDFELRGVGIHWRVNKRSISHDCFLQIVDVEASQLSMYGTKVEIKLKKAEPGAWSKLEIPRALPTANTSKKEGNLEEITPQVEAVDLSDL